MASTSYFSRSYKKAPDGQLQKILPTGRAFPKLTKGPWREVSVWVSASTLSAVARCIEMQRSPLFCCLPLWHLSMWFWLTQELKIRCKSLTAENAPYKCAAVGPAQLIQHQGMVFPYSAMKRAEQKLQMSKPSLPLPPHYMVHHTVVAPAITVLTKSWRENHGIFQSSGVCS